MTAHARASRGAGFTLVEVAIVLVVVTLLASVAWPSVQAHLVKSRRSDAVAALMRVQWAQEQYRAHHGLYASQLQHLQPQGGSLSAEGLYAIALRPAGPDGYLATARARPERGQAGDRDCLELTLDVHEGRASPGPTLRCWNR